MKASRVDRAWAAGFFDAEGCFARSGTPVATLSQTQLECLDVFIHVVEAGTIKGPYIKATKLIPRKPQWVYYAYGERAQAVYGLLEPWLGTYRRAQAAKSLLLATPSNELPSFADLSLKERLAWAGGFFDGEGCFCTSVRDGALHASITSTDFELVSRFVDAVGIGKINGPYGPSPKSFSKKPYYTYVLHGFERTQALLAMLWPNLGSAKRTKAIAMFSNYRTFWKCGHRRGPRWKMHCPKCFHPGPKPGFKNRLKN